MCGLCQRDAKDRITEKLSDFAIPRVCPAWNFLLQKVLESIKLVLSFYSLHDTLCDLLTHHD